MSYWDWLHCRNCLISQAQGPVGSLGPAAGGAGAAGAAAGGAGAGAEEPPENIPVMALPATWPTAEPTATPPAVAAI